MVFRNMEYGYCAPYGWVMVTPLTGGAFAVHLLRYFGYLVGADWELVTFFSGCPTPPLQIEVPRGPNFSGSFSSSVPGGP